MEVHPYYHSLPKRLFDLITAIVLLVILSPLLLLISLVVLVTAGWPVFYTQKRYGKHKQIFTIYKFRVMYVGAEKNQWRYQDESVAPAPMYKNWNDPRFVGIGRWLSKTGLDELPQLLNIIKGEMSFVGPRPLPVYEAKELPKSWDFRYQVRPGVFSEWSAASPIHQTLKTWNRLERETLQAGGFKQDVNYIITTMQKVFLH